MANSSFYLVTDIFFIFYPFSFSELFIFIFLVSACDMTCLVFWVSVVERQILLLSKFR